jgi:hypothetical protein
MTGQNGVVIGAGSTTDTGLYSIYKDMELQRMPDWLFEKLNPVMNKEQTEQQKQERIQKRLEYEQTKDMGETEVTIRKCLEHHSPNCDYDKWVKTGMIIKRELGDDSFEIWDDWSSKGDSYDSSIMEAKWNSFREDGELGIGTLIKWAMEAGMPPLSPTTPLKYHFVEDEDDEVFLKDGANDATRSVTEAIPVEIHSTSPMKLAPSLAIDNQILRTCFDYKILKETFERQVFRIQKPSLFYVMKSNGEYDIMNVKGLKDSYSHVNHEVEKSKKIMGGIVKQNVKHSFVDAWLKDGDAKMYEYEEFDPSNTSPSYVYNTFKGFVGKEYKKRDGDITPIIVHMQLLLKEHYEYVLKWLANIIQNPTRKTTVALILHSTKEGAGKTKFVEWFAHKVMGKLYFKKTSDPSNDLFGRFSTAINNRLLITLEEAKGQDIRPNMDKLKDMITSSEAKWELKGSGSVMNTKNYASFIFLTNNDNPVTISFSDRRFAGFNCDNDMCQNAEYFDKLDKVMESEEVAGAFYDYLVHMDLKGFNFQNRPQTEYYKELQRINIPSWAKFFSWTYNLDYSQKTYSGVELYSAYKRYVEYGGYEAISSTAFGMKLKLYVGEGKPIQKVKSNGVMKYSIDWEKLKEQLQMEKLWDDDAI